TLGRHSSWQSWRYAIESPTWLATPLAARNNAQGLKPGQRSQRVRVDKHPKDAAARRAALHANLLASRWRSSRCCRRQADQPIAKGEFRRLQPTLHASRRAIAGQRDDRPLYKTRKPFVPESTCRKAGCRRQDRKSTRLNSSHVKISYAVFC